MIGKLNLCFGDWTPGQHWFQQILGGGLDSISGLYKFPKLFNVSHLKPSFLFIFGNATLQFVQVKGGILII